MLEWSATPESAFDTLLALNNHYALDGRDPSSYAEISWVSGRYERGWGPERPFYGRVRYMSSDNTLRKLRMKRYLAKWS